MKFTRNTNIIIMVSVGIIWLFIAANIDRTLGLAYLVMLLFYGLMWKSGKVYPIAKGEFDFGRNFSIILLASFFLIFIDSNIVRLFSVADTAQTSLPKPFITPLSGIETRISYSVYLFILMITVPITEELFFRGSLIPFFNSQFNNDFLTAIVSSGSFGIWHYYAYGGAIAQMIMASIFGLVAWYIVRKKGELIHVIFMHGIFNGFTEWKERFVV